MERLLLPACLTLLVAPIAALWLVEGPDIALELVACILGAAAIAAQIWSRRHPWPA